MSVAPIEQRVPGAWADRLPAAAPAAKRPLRLLMVTPRFFPLTGGVETHVFEVARRLVAAGVDVTVLTSNPGGKWPQREAYDGVPVERVPAWPADRDYYYAPDLFNVIGRGDWDLMHLQCYHTLVAPLAMLAARRAGLPYVVTFHPGGHSSPVRNRLRGVQQLLLRPLLAHAARLITVARFELEHFHSLLRLPRERFTYIPNGCDVGGLEVRRGADRKQVVRVPIHPTAGADEDVCAPRTGGADEDVCAPRMLGYISATTGIGGLFVQMATQRLGELLPPLLRRYAERPDLALRSVQTALYPLFVHDADETPTAELLSIMVEPAARSQGVGGLLMVAFLSSCRNQGLGAVTVTVDAANGGAQRFYARHGFAPWRDITLYGRAMRVYRRPLT